MIRYDKLGDVYVFDVDRDVSDRVGCYVLSWNFFEDVYCQDEILGLVGCLARFRHSFPPHVG